MKMLMNHKAMRRRQEDEEIRQDTQEIIKELTFECPMNCEKDCDTCEALKKFEELKRK